MPEITSDLRGLPRSQAWSQIAAQLDAVLEGVDDPITAMATTSALVHHGLGLLWTGFYRVVQPGLLRVGPYQGTLGCLEISFGKGVCGTCAATGKSVVVPNVHDFPGHIACDGRAASELVVPVFNGMGALIAVFDLDSEVIGAFDTADARAVKRILHWFASR